MDKQLLNDLQERIHHLEHAQRKTQWPARISSGFASLDGLLPGQGFHGGTLVEWLSAGPGMGAMTLALAVAGQVIQGEGVLVVVDAKRDFFPAAASLGVPLERTVVVQPDEGDVRTQWWVWEQSLRSEAVAATLGGIDRADERVVRRLQLAAQTGGGLGLLLRPLSCRKTACWADLRLLVQSCGDRFSTGPKFVGQVANLPAAPTGSRTWRLQVELLACRSGPAGGKSVVELSDETHPVPLAAELDRAAHPPRQAGA